MTKTIKAARFDDLTIKTRDENIERCECEGVRYCQCCGRKLKPESKTFPLRMIEGGEFFTEYEGEDIPEELDLAWWDVGATCYKKYKAAEKDFEVEVRE